MSSVKLVFNEVERAKSQALLAMSAALDTYNPSFDPHTEPFKYASQEEKVSEAVRLAEELRRGQATEGRGESALAEQFLSAIKTLQTGRPFTDVHRKLSEDLEDLGLRHARNCYHLANTA